MVDSESSDYGVMTQVTVRGSPGLIPIITVSKIEPDLGWCLLFKDRVSFFLFFIYLFY